jgi:hypothetical protein
LARQTERERLQSGRHFGSVNYRFWPGGAAGGRYRRQLARHDPYETVTNGGLQRDPILMWIKIDPMMKSLADEPRFKALLRQMKLPE